MERSERLRLEGIRRRLSQDLAAIDQLLKVAKEPKRLSGAEIRARAAAVSRDLHGVLQRQRKTAVDIDTLRRIVSKRGMPFTAVGSLYVGGYLKKTGSGGTALGKRGLAAVGRGRGS